MRDKINSEYIFKTSNIKGDTNMTLNKAFALRISEILLKKKMSKYQLEKRSGISHSALRYIFNEVNTDLKFSTIVKVVDALDMTLDEFFKDSVFNLENLDF